jgi:carboxypeptidase C (cathepsin A)
MTPVSALATLVSVGLVSGAINKDLVTSLPGIAQLPSPATYSGYLDIPGGKHLHYIFYTSQSGNSNDPLILWFNGGPGCSSLEGAFSGECGTTRLITVCVA